MCDLYSSRKRGDFPVLIGFITESKSVYIAVGIEFINTVPSNPSIYGRAVAKAVGDRPLRRPGFDQRPVLVLFVVDNVTLWQGFRRILRFSPVSVIPRVLHTQLQLHVALTRRANERRLGTFRKAMLFRQSGRTGQTCTGALSLC